MPVLERFSFWIGFITATIFWWLLGRLGPFLRWIYKQFLQTVRSIRQRASRSFEEKYLTDILRYAQGLHLASPLFALDEILVTPRILSQPPLLEPTLESPVLPIVSQTIPFIPNCPEFHAIFNTPTLSLAEALSGNANLLLLGNPGYGKTVALAHLASLIARHDQSIGELTCYTPVLIHVEDINFSVGDIQDPLQNLISGICNYAPNISQKRLSTLLKLKLKESQVLVLLDGTDEMPPASIQQIVIFLKNLLYAYPQIRLVVAASPDYHDGLLSLGLIPVFMAAWSVRQRNGFIENWGKKWNEHISSIISTVNPSVDSLLLKNWLKDRPLYQFNTPFEETLRLWAVYCGDNLGPLVGDAIESYLRRTLSGGDKKRQKLGKLAIQMLSGASDQIIYEDILSSDVEKTPSQVFSSLDDPELTPPEVNPDPGVQKSSKRKQSTKSGKATLEKQKSAGVRSDLLIERTNNRISFIHPVISAYLAGEAAVKNLSITEVLNMQQWTTTQLFSSFFLAHYPSSSPDISEHFSAVVRKQISPIEQSLTNTWQWLRLSPKSAAWRQLIMRHLADAIQDSALALPLRTKLFWILVTSGEPGVIVLFRHLLLFAEPDIRYLGALGCGLLNDVKSLSDLQSLVSDHDIKVSQAALLALSVMNQSDTLDTITTALLTGGENLRQLAAEILADHPDEGHDLLIEASSYDDVAVRRAAVFGLIKIAEPWAIDILKKLEIEDKQWVVRNAAERALFKLNQPRVEIPLPYPPLKDTPWLISMAGKSGVGIPTEEAARDMLFSAIKNGEEEQKLCALRRVIHLSGISEGMISVIYQLLYGSEPDLRDEAYDTLWYLAACGEKLPPPTQYGLS